MAEQLSIKVRVDLPSAGEIERQLNKELRGMKDIETNVKVKPKVTGLKGLKGEIRKSLNGEKFKANVGVKVTGEAKLAKLAREMEKVRRLANEPIKFSVDAGNSKFDEQVAKARKGIDEFNKSYIKGAGLGLRKQVEEARRNMEQTYAAMRKNNLDATKANNDRVAQVYKESAAQNKAQLQKDIAEYRRLSEDAGIGRKDINKQIRRSTTPSIKDETAQRLAQTRREISAAKRDWQDYGRIMKEAYSTEQKMAKGTAGRNETRALRERAAALRSEAEAIKLIPEYREKANRAERAQQRNLSMINAKRLDGAYASNVRRTRTRGGIVPTMDVGSALMTGAMGIAGIISQFNDVDKAITKVTKVVPDSQRAVNRWKKNIYKDAAEVGKTAPEFASAVEQWATAGYNLKQSNKLAKQSVMGAFVGEVPVNDMVKYMSVPMKAFQKEGIKSVDIINAMNQVSNKHAIEMDDLGAAYQKASSTVGATGTKFSQLTGIITAAQEGTRAGGDAIGTAYKTIGSRIAKMGTGLTKQDQTRAAFFKGLGVNLTDTNGKLKSTWDVMDQLGKKWNTLSEQDKNTAAQYAAGANHANIFQATMDNWKTARQAMREAEDQQGLGSDGSAYQEMAKQKQSVEFQLKGLQDMWGQFVENITGGRKGISDMLNLATGLGGGLLKLSANPFLSSAVRWGAVATGMVMARKAMVSLAGGLGSVILQGKKGDNVLERLTGLSSKTQKMRDSVNGLKDAWGELTGRGKSNRGSIATDTEGYSSELNQAKLKLQGSSSQGLQFIGDYDIEGLKKNTSAYRENTEAKKSNSRAQNEMSSGMKKVGDHFVPANTQLSKTTNKVSKLGKVAKVFGSGLGVLSAGLGYVGLALDAVTIAGIAMNAMGIHPIKALQKAMNPAGESAKQFSKYIDDVGSSVDKTSNKIENNGLVTGRISNSIKSAKELRDILPTLQTKDGKYTGDAFESLKKNYNEIAKSNGLELRIRGSENVDQVNQKMTMLQSNLKQVKKEAVEDLGDSITKNLSNIKKLTSQSSLNKLMTGNKAYQSQLDKIRSQYDKDMGGNVYKADRRRYNKQVDDLRDTFTHGYNNSQMWNSSNGKRLAKAIQKAQRSVRDGIDGYASNLADGTLTTKDIKSMDTQTVQYAALGALKNLMSLRGTDDGDKSKTDAQRQFSDIMSQVGVGAKAIEKISGMFSKSQENKGINGQLLSALNKSGIDKSALAAYAGISGQYMTQHGMKRDGSIDISKAINAAAKDMSGLEKYIDRARKKGNRFGSDNAQALIDPNTGYINYQKLAEFNAGKATYGAGRKRLKTLGIDSSKDMSATQLADWTTGLAGDPTKILNAISGGKGSVRQIAAVTNNKHAQFDDNGNIIAGTGATANQMLAAVAGSSNGFKNLSENKFNPYVNDMVADGLITKEQGDAMIQSRSKNYTKDGHAKNYKAAMDQVGDKQLTEDAFKGYAKNLDKNARKQLANALKKSGQISKDAYDDLMKDFVPKGKKPSKPNNEKDKDDGIKDSSGKSGKSKPKNKDDDDNDGGGKSKPKPKNKPSNAKNNSNKGTNSNSNSRKPDRSTPPRTSKNQQKALEKAAQGKQQTKSPNLIPNLLKKLGLITDAKADTKPKTAKDVEKNLKGRKISDKELKNAQALLKNKKEQKKLEDDLRKNGQLKTSKPSSSNSNKKNSSKNKKQAEKEGREEEKACQKGRDSAEKTSSKKSNSSKKQNQEQKDLAKQLNKGKGVKVKLQPDAKSLTKGLKNLGGKKGTKIKLQPDTKSLTKGLKNLGGKKGTKVKLQADTKGLTKDLKNLGGKNGTKVKLQADTKSLTKSLSNLGKGKGVKVKLQADTKGLDKSLKSLKGLKKSQNIKINVSGNASSKISKIKSSLNGLSGKSKNISINVRGNAVSQVNKIKSALNGIKGSKNISINASGNAASFASKVKSSLAGIHNKHVNISASGNALSTINQVKGALGGLRDKSITITANDNATGPINRVKSARNSLKDKRFTVTADVGQALGALGQVQGLLSSIEGVHTASVVVNKTVNISEKHSKSKSIGITPEDVNQSVNPLRSMSVVAGNPQLTGIVDASAQSMGLAADANSAMNGQKVTDYSDSTQKVNEDYWRYMGNELYTGLPLDEQVNKLEGAVTQADDNMDKLIDLARQRIDLDNRQIAYQKTMQSAYQQQITDMINELHKYGFQNNGNQITNLNHAKDITGDNASKVDELLGKYQSAYQNFSQATQKIQELQTDVWQQGKNQEDYRNTKDQKMVENLQRELELINTSIENQKNILDRENDSLTDNDYRMKLKNSSDQIYSKSDAVQQLLAEFNKLSLTNFVGTKDADNAKNLADSLSSIKDSIMENLDAIDELKTSIRDIKLNALIDNVDKIADNLSNSVDRLKNNVTNLQDGLLSGTTYSDLISSDLDVVNLNQKGAYEKGVEDKIRLERELDSVLDQFARKNVDRTAQVANEQLQIEAQKYNQMLSMATSYARGTRWESSKIQANYNATTESDQIEISDITHNQEYVKASIEYQKQLNELKGRYNEQMSNADSAETKQLINQRLVYEQLMLQEKVYGTMIETDKQAIAELRKQFNDPDMNSEQLKTISDKITEYENNIMDAQNNIKEAIKGRYDYEKTLLDKEIDQYQRLSDTMSNLVTIADALHLKGETQASVINQQYEATYLQYSNYLDILARLREERSQFDKGSFEWNQIDSMIQEYQPALESIVTSLFEINKNEFEQKLSSVQEYFEKNVNEGKTADQAKFDQDVWYNPVQKELRLEEMRLKIVELEDKTVEKRIAALDAQERTSKAEADYVDKQLDLALAQQKLNNTINKKDVRYLEKDENGKFNWTYIADQEQVDAARQEVNQAKQAIEDAKVSNRNDYIEKMEQVASKIQDGSINQEEAKKRFEELNNSYKFVLKDIPGFDVTKGEDILQAFNEYEQRNKDILNDYRRNDNISNKAGYKEIIDGFGEQFKMVSKDLGEIFGKQLHDALSLPSGIRNAYGNGTDNSLTINGDLKVELPDVTNVDEFAKAIATLPQVARQKATSK
ncbi:hypothetical protein BBP13_10360 [Limosilactobacillus reuteri]|uniref:phage tail tape measure protein n=1 Tax=Limosilactobacillus reuteri TaxID=1598 RepID=UPI00081BE924|nr:phage tail tape measure protein [Limosilactobacillus reuteri]OCW71654.1 hypothetical protein BBP13_10360 [Limosilactobacillus reuteri]